MVAFGGEEGLDEKVFDDVREILSTAHGEGSFGVDILVVARAGQSGEATEFGDGDAVPPEAGLVETAERGFAAFDGGPGVIQMGEAGFGLAWVESMGWSG